MALANPRLLLRDSVYPLRAETVSIGRDASSDLPIADVLLSRRHALLTRDGSAYRIQDLDSLNGTFVNGVPVKEHALVHGDEIAIGGARLLYLTEELSEVSEPVEPVELSLGATLQMSPEESIYTTPERVPDPQASLVARGSVGGLQALLAAGRLVASARSAEELGGSFCDLMLQAFPCERAAFLVASEDPERLTPVAGRTRTASAPFPVSRAVTRHVTGTRQGFLTNDAQDLDSAVRSESLFSAGASSLLAAPLVAAGRVEGLLYADGHRPATRFAEEHLQLLMGLANVAAASLESVRRTEWLEEERRRLEAEAQGGAELLGESPRMRAVFDFLARAAPTSATVLLLGESGTGKEVVARILHRRSPRAERPFIAINGAALTESLLESELFGHEKGAFTGAVSRTKGKLEVADGGTLFLDEVGELPLTVQAKLLRVLEERAFERVGGTNPIHVDIRLVAATNRDLTEAVKTGGFRGDLYHRLNVLTLELPPLRERPEDVPLLARYFAARFAERYGKRISGLTPEARERLARYEWPGNVRELSNAIERAVVLAQGTVLSTEDLPEALLEREGTAGEKEESARYHEAVNDAKRRIVREAVEEAGGSIADAARRLGIHPNNLHRLIRNLGLKAELSR